MFVNYTLNTGSNEYTEKVMFMQNIFIWNIDNWGNNVILYLWFYFLQGGYKMTRFFKMIKILLIHIRKLQNKQPEWPGLGMVSKRQVT